MEDACKNFRAYLHSSGVGEALGIALLQLYRLNKKPTNPIEFIRQNIPPQQEVTIAGLTAELDELNKDIEKLRKMIPQDKLPALDEELEKQAETVGDEEEIVKAPEENAEIVEGVDNPEKTEGGDQISVMKAESVSMAPDAQSRVEGSIHSKAPEIESTALKNESKIEGEGLVEGHETKSGEPEPNNTETKIEEPEPSKTETKTA